MKTKENFHKLIDKIEDEELLKNYYSLILRLNETEPGSLWEKLTKQEREELLASHEESFDTVNLLPHSDVKKRYAK